MLIDAGLRALETRAHLDEDTVHVWSADYETIRDRQLWMAYHGLLSAQERSRAQRFHFERDRRRYIATRALVRLILSRYTAVSPAEWRFDSSEYGRPRIVSPALAAPPSFSISHSHHLIVLALRRRGALGVDIENTQVRQAPLEVAERYFAADEVRALRLLGPQEQIARFWECWTLKESYVKARGMGLALPLDGIAFAFPRPGEVSIRVAAQLERPPTRWWLWQCRPAPDYLAALCAERADDPRPAIEWRALLPPANERLLSIDISRLSAS